jgi:hypothetical protein
MKGKNTYLLLTITSLSFFVFITCKKYPENTLWFKKPTKIPVIQGYITEYKVNGIDSLPYLNSFYSSYTVGVSPPYPPYTSSNNKDIKREKFTTTIEGLGHGTLSVDYLGNGYYKWANNNKNIIIFFKPDVYYFYKNIFIKKEDITWEVLYLDKKGKKSKIKTIYNSNTYEITFEN